MHIREFLTLAALAAVGACHSDSPTAPQNVALATPTCGAAAVVRLAANQAATFACTSGTFINLAGGAKYLISPQFASGGLSSNINDTPVPYQIGVTTAGVAARVAPNAAVAPAPTASLGMAQQLFDLKRRAHDRQMVASGRVRPSFNTARSVLPALATVPDSGSLRTFNVITDVNANFATGTSVARLEYVGQNVLLYVDTLAPANGFTEAQLQAFGGYFDQTLYGIDIGAFGQPSDIDGNGHVIMLLSPSVNGLTAKADCQTQGYIAGYFDGDDLLNVTGSNSGEIFYSVVPDPSGTVSCSHTVADLLGEVPSTFLHELQHLISFSQHAIIRNGDPEEGWLDEGMSIRAEELGSEYYEAKFPPPSGRSNPAQLFPDSSQGFIGGILNDSYDYLLKPDTASLTLHTDADNGFSWRGGDWLLVHWLGDLKGKSIYTTLEHGNAVGIANIEAAAGESFGSLFGDFSLALWTDSIVGTPRSAIPARDRFQTRNLRVLMNRVFQTGGASSGTPLAMPLVPVTLNTTSPVVASMVPGTPAFYILDLTGSSSNTPIQFSAPGGAAFSSALGSLGPQVSIYRLP